MDGKQRGVKSGMKRKRYQGRKQQNSKKGGKARRSVALV